MIGRILSVAAAMVFLVSAPASAQLDSRPFSFKNSLDGGIGMSIGGREAIINDKLFGVQPENLVRDQNGILLDITKAPGNLPVVSRSGGGLIPGFRGTSFTGDNPMMAAGVFNNFFVPAASRGGNYACCYTQEESSATINTWTARVVSGGMGVSYDNDSLVDIWTGQVFTLAYY